MNMATKQEVLKAHLKEWLACKDNRVKRGELNKQLAKAVQIHIKSVARAMKSLQLASVYKPKRKPGRERFYDNSVDVAIYTVWESMDFPCAEVMKPVLADYVESFIRNKEWVHGSEATTKLHLISVGTLKRRLTSLSIKHNTLRGYSTTKPNTIQLLIPIKKSHTWVGLKPGHGQMDTVAHCGDLLAGDFIYSLGMVDYNTYWTEYDAQWNKGMLATRETIANLVSQFPFIMVELHPDTGSEFINIMVYEWTKENDIAMTRSEPNKKNDNMCIEERNNTLARRHLGYVRLDKIEYLPLAQEILRTACLIHNHFRPVRRMITKERVGAKWKREIEKVSLTPYERVLLSLDVSKAAKEKLRAEHQELDPLSLQRKLAKLKQELYQKINKK